LHSPPSLFSALPNEIIDDVGLCTPGILRLQGPPQVLPHWAKLESSRQMTVTINHKMSGAIPFIFARHQCADDAFVLECVMIFFNDWRASGVVFRLSFWLRLQE
jgi:hypothetical protein